MTWQTIWLFASPIAAGAGIVAITLAFVRQDGARTRKRSTSPDG